jgi:hypothetical protein
LKVIVNREYHVKKLKRNNKQKGKNSKAHSTGKPKQQPDLSEATK